MKRAWCFIPTAAVFAALFFVLSLAGSPSGRMGDYLVGFVILSVFVVSDWLLFSLRWYGGIPGVLLGLSIVVYGSRYHGQVFDERPIGVIIFTYYLLHALILRKKHITKN